MTALEMVLSIADKDTLDLIWRMVGKEKLAFCIAKDIAAATGISLNASEVFQIVGPTDTSRKLVASLRSRARSAFKHRGRNDHYSMSLVGCSVGELMSHLEAKFQEGMSWDNYPAWHIDHIRPCSSFDLSDPKQQELCFNYKNLQPLWAKDNMKKGAKYVAL